MHKERFGQDACASLVTLLGFQSRSFASETNNLSFEQLPALHLQTGVGHVQTEELQFRVANRLNQIPKVALPNGHSRQHLVRRVAVIVAAFVNEQEHGQCLSKLAGKGTLQNGPAEAVWPSPAR